MNIDLTKEANRWAIHYLAREKLGSDEEVQMLAAAYAQLFLLASEGRPNKDLGASHKVIADCYKKLCETEWEQRHRALAKAYEN